LLEPKDPKEPGFFQIFVVGDAGTEEAKLQVRKATGQGKGTCKKHQILDDIVNKLMNILYNVNTYGKKFETAREILGDSPKATLALVGINQLGLDNKRFSM
jgi:hypothetical protein